MGITCEKLKNIQDSSEIRGAPLINKTGNDPFCHLLSKKITKCWINIHQNCKNQIIFYQKTTPIPPKNWY